MENVLVEVNTKLEILYTMKKKIEELTETVDFYSEQYQQMFEFKQSAERKITAMEQKNFYLEKYCKALEERIAMQEYKVTKRILNLVG